MQKAYHDKRVVQGSDSNQIIYLDNIPNGYQVYARHMAAGIYTTNPGDYTTAKFIWLGYEQNGVKFYLEGCDINLATGLNQGLVFVKNFYVPERARPFAYVEATSTSQKIEFMINGEMIKLGE